MYNMYMFSGASNSHPISLLPMCPADIVRSYRWNVAFRSNYKMNSRHIRTCTCVLTICYRTMYSHDIDIHMRVHVCIGVCEVDITCIYTASTCIYIHV